MSDRVLLTACLCVIITSFQAAFFGPANSCAQVAETQIDFGREIRPLLSDRCFSCHGPDAEQRQADLRLDQLDSLLEDRDGYQVLKPGNAAESELIRRITSHDESEVMPPESAKRLSESEKDLLIRWVGSGAAWQQHWAYEQPTYTPTPVDPKLTQTANNWLDVFVAKQLAVAAGHFSDPADKITLIRRLSFDLTGLPPRVEHLQAVLRDESPLAIQQYVESLLASPTFGERMAAYWLDLVRFADTVGYHGDQVHHISLYRDYVIDAFNDNRPFDQFSREQLAGDLLPDPTEEQIIATGYNRMLQTSHEGGVQPKEYLAIYAADRVRNFSAVWMGATVGCAQCHDHKFDPFSAHDFYSLAAFFADVDEAQHFSVGSDSSPTRRPPEKPYLDRAQRQQLWAAERERQRLLDIQRQASVGQASVPTIANGEETEEHVVADSLVTQLDRVEKQIDAIRAGARQTMITVSTAPRTIRYLPRGNWLDDSGDVMQPAIPSFMGSLQQNADRATRLELAKWLFDMERGAGLLTARVFVNRLWLLLFGQGLSRSVEDFGGQGEPPTHPELLDRLAIEFVQSGWDIKHILRLLTSSRAYQQASLESQWHRSEDPQNRLWARQNRFRISAEMIRDTALACSNLLVSDLGGESVKPYQPDGYYRHLNFPTREYQHSTDDGQWRRGLYVHWQRQFLHPMLRVFDAPTREECTAQRTQSNTPLAALVWLNDPSLIEAARSLSLRILLDAPEHGLQATAQHRDERLIHRLFQLTTSRLPDVLETELLQQLLVRSRSEFTAAPQRCADFLGVGLFAPPVRLAQDEWAAWTSVARAVLNLNETYTRN